MKKTLLILVLAGALAGGIFAQGVFKPDFVGSAGLVTGFEFAETKGDSLPDPAKQDGVPIVLYADMTYATLGVGISFITSRDSLDPFSALLGIEEIADVTRIYVPISLVFKYPLTFGANRNIRVFPQAGIEYRIFLQDDYGTREDYDDLYGTANILNGGETIDNYSANYLDQFSILAGIGAEVDLPAIGGLEGLYVRFNGLADIWLPSAKEKDADDTISHFGMKFQLGVGYKIPM